VRQLDTISSLLKCNADCVVDGVPSFTVVLYYRLVKIEYDVLEHVIRATVETQTPLSAKVANVALWVGSNPSVGIASVTNVIRLA
jgi:hypothetical protein